jgi:hypothetical protein
MDCRSDKRKIDPQYTLENICSPGCPCQDKEHHTHLNLVRNPMKEGVNVPERKHINIRGREEHEAVIKDAEWCKELGLDQTYEICVYLKRWGGWLSK